ncbi:MAG: hypothetical protein REI94_08760 [Moraxellaceae bacterium]|nr:hypothetical protein [Moraxellaceae bacterium]
MILTNGTAREPIDSRNVADLRRAGVLIEDARRERPRYFDGRFLAARDLIRDQQYFLTREADLGRAAGSGVAAGLFVDEGGNAQTLKLTAGHGVTPAGELVLLPRPLDVQLANIPVAEQLSARFGLSRQPAPPLRSRTGLFVLALRPVEFTANPIGAYPTSITGQRTVEDGDVIEATAIVLVPWQDDGAADALDARRGRVARNVFVSGKDEGLSANVLPLAMLALQNNTIVWIDEAMVRRELGADRGDLPGLGFAPRALRLAHLMQYQEHLRYVVSKSNGRSFPAGAHFPALPSAGPLPKGVINVADFTQNFFPAEIDVDFTIVPEDELPALIEEALALQPIDLTVPVETLDSTAVMILAPVPRHQWRAVEQKLKSVVVRTIKPAAPNLLAQRKPLEVLQRLRVPRPALGTLDTSNPVDAEWQRLAGLTSLWFVRRRHVAYRDDYTGAWKQVTGIDERATEDALRSRLTSLGLERNFDAMLKNTTPAAAATITNMLASNKFAESPALTAAAIGSLNTAVKANAETGKLDEASALQVASDLNTPGTGDGLQKVEQAVGSDKVANESLQEIAKNDDWKKTDAAASVATKEEIREIAIEKIKLKPGVVIDTKPVDTKPVVNDVKPVVTDTRIGTPVADTPTKVIASPVITNPALRTKLDGVVVKPVITTPRATPKAAPRTAAPKTTAKAPAKAPAKAKPAATKKTTTATKKK